MSSSIRSVGFDGHPINDVDDSWRSIVAWTQPWERHASRTFSRHDDNAAASRRRVRGRVRSI